MDNARWQQIEDIFQTAIELEPAAREAYLTQVCGADQELRREVASLLAHEVFDTFIQEPIQGAAQALADAAEPGLLGAQLGPYRVTELIGAGGMGAVYAAVRDDAEQFQQQVAIKIVKRGMGSQFILNRFRAERRILAGLEHPHIARLLDGGTTADGRPYFVMEFIAGQPINQYCAAQQLSIADRLKLFRQVCSAVQYAHQKLVVHRDLKPGNILVNSDGAPKLLDFGIAKLLDPAQAGADPARTATLMRMLTPDYASPEQVRGSAISTATDVYSLGAVLYELLTGQRPHRLQRYTPTEIERVICEVEVERPSAAVNGADAAKLRRQLAGDLDNIILMAMRKEPERRYQSVEQLADDLRRHLEGHPVSARSDTAGYRAGKFVRRHKVGLAATALVMASLFSGLIATNYQARRAERRFQQVRKLANTFLFDFHDKIVKLPGSTEARELVVKTALDYLDSLAQEAEGDAALQLELAQAYLRVGVVRGDLRSASLGKIEAAIVSYRKGLALAEKLADSQPDNTALFETLTDLHINLGSQQAFSGDVAGGIAELRQAMRAAEKINARNPNKQEHMILLIRSYEALGDAELKNRDLAAALHSYRRTLQLAERQAAEFPSDRSRNSLALTLSRLGDVLAEQGDLTAAIENYRSTLLIRELLSQSQPTNVVFQRELKVAYNWAGNFSGNPYFLNLGDTTAAAQYYRQSLKMAEELVAVDSKNTLAQFDLGVSCEKMGDILAKTEPAQAAEFYRRALAATGGLLALAPNQYRFLRRHLVFQTKLSATLGQLGEHKAALQQLRQTLAQLQKLSAENSANSELQADLHTTLGVLAAVLLATGERAEALQRATESRALAEQMVAANAADLYAQWRLANAYAGLGRHYATLAAAPKSQLSERLANWRAARDWHQKALGVWDDWGNRAVSSVFNTTRREQSARAVAQCQAALEKLGAPTQP